MPAASNEPNSENLAGSLLKPDSPGGFCWVPQTYSNAYQRGSPLPFLMPQPLPAPRNRQLLSRRMSYQRVRDAEAAPAGTRTLF